MEEGGQTKKFKHDPDGGGNTNNNNNSNDVPLKSRRVYVANVPFDVKWSELKDLFREKVGDVTYCTIFENEDGKSRGCGLVEFADPQVARTAIETMHRSEFKSRELVVKEDLDCERDRFGRIITQHGNNRSRDDSQRRDGGNNDRGGGGGNRDRGNRQQNQQMIQNTSYGFDHSVMSNAYAPHQQHNTFGLSQEFLNSLSIGLPLNNRIFVANLEYKVDQKKLEEIFKLAGRVSRVNLVYDNVTKNSKGYATITFEHPVEAVQAISMFNNQKLYGRTMSVRMDKYECEDDQDQLPTKLPNGLESIGKGLGVGGQPLNVAKSIMNAAVIAPPHLTVPGQPHMTHPQMHPQAVQQPAAMQQAVIAAQMQQLQQQQHAGAIPQPLQQTLPPTMQHQLQQSLQQPMQQQYQMLTQPQQQAMQQQGVPSMAYQTIQQLQAANAIRAPQAANVYQQPQQATQQAPTQAQQQQQQQPPAQQLQQQPQQQQPPTSVPATNLSVYSTFERQFREASAPQGFTRN